MTGTSKRPALARATLASVGSGLRRDQNTFGRSLRAGRWESAVGFVVGLALCVCAGLAGSAAIVGLATDQRDVGAFGALAAAYGLVGGAVAISFRVPRRLRSSTAFVGVLAVWLTLIAASVLAYEVLDTFRVWDDSLFESVAGFTTTASTVVRDPEALSRATLWWRAGTQWVGGLGALLFVVTILPSIGVGGLEVTEAGQRHSGVSIQSRRTKMQLRHLTTVYLTLSTMGIALFLVGGMGPFDAVTYAATTISTGGFANHTGSFAHFSSPRLEWAGFGGMVLGGANLALLFAALRTGRSAKLWRSMELRAYLVVIAVGGAIVTATTAGDTGWSHATVRRAFFHVASAASTTGHFVEGWGSWDPGPQVVLLAILGVGSMSGSAGGGFRMVRALVLTAHLRRQLITQIHPQAVAPARVGRRVVSDALVTRMIGYQAQYLIAASIGAIAVATLGGELITSISTAISAVANMGPALGDMVPGSGGVSNLARPARAALMPLMLVGRLEIAPVLVGAVVVVTGGARRVDAGFDRFRSDDLERS